MEKNPESSPDLQIEILGGIRAIRRNGAVVSFPTRKCKALLALLVFAGDKGLSREYCANLLWSRSREAQARSSLRQCVLSLRRALSPDHGGLVAYREQIKLDPASIGTDLDLFNILEQDTAGSRPTSILLRLRDNPFGDFSLNEPPFEDWQRQIRNQHSHRLNRALACASRLWRESGSVSDALDAARVAIDVDPFNEEALRELMHCHLARGSSGQALTAFDEFRHRLRIEIGGEPSAKTAALVSEIRFNKNHQEIPEEAGETVSDIPTLQIAIAGPTASNDGSGWGMTCANDLHDGLVLRTGRRRGIRTVSAAKDPTVEAPDYTLSGRVSVQPEGARVTFRLYRAATSEDVWVEQMDVSNSDAHFEIIDRVCDRVDAAVRMWTNAFDTGRIGNVPDTALNVPQALTRAAGYLYAGTIDGHEQALCLISTAIATEPANYMALAMRVESELMLMACGARQSSEQTLAKQCLSLANQSVSLAPGSDYVFAIRSMLKVTALRDLEGGLYDADRAIKLSPSYVWGHLARAQVLLAIGDLKDALRAFDGIVQMSQEDPYLPLYAHMLCRAALLCKEFERAERAAKICADRLPDAVSFQLLHAVSLAGRKGIEAAAPALECATKSRNQIHLLAIRTPLADQYTELRDTLLRNVNLDPNDDQSTFVL